MGLQHLIGSCYLILHNNGEEGSVLACRRRTNHIVTELVGIDFVKVGAQV